MKRIFALLLSLLLCLSILAGCGSDKKADNGKQQAITADVNKNESSKSINTAGNRDKIKIDYDGTYTDKVHVAAYINQFQKLPGNYITKNQAKKLGWQTKGTLDKVAPGKSIGGDRFGNYEKRVPDKKGRSWKECDIDYIRGNRNAKRIVFSNDGLIYYTENHYKSFTKLY